jgi:phage/plasmid-associated DNA primase
MEDHRELTTTSGEVVKSFELVSGEITLPDGLDATWRGVVAPAMEHVPRADVRFTVSGVELLLSGLHPVVEARIQQQFGLAVAAVVEHRFEIGMRDLARTFEDAHRGRDVLYVADAGQFSVWENGVWVNGADADTQVSVRVREFSDDLDYLVHEVLPPRPGQGPDPWSQWRQRQKALSGPLEHRNSLRQDSRTGLAIMTRDFEHAEADRPFLINTPAGVLDLREPEATPRPVSPWDLFRCRTRGVYRPGFGCRDLDFVLGVILGGRGPEAERYLQQLLGAGLLGIAGLKSWVHLWGAPHTLKTTLAAAYGAALGSYGVDLGESAVLAGGAGSGAAHTSALMPLARGPRAAVVPEVSEGARLNGPLLKGLTGGDPLRISEKFKPHQTIHPRLTVFTVSNHGDLEVGGADPAVFERRLLPFHFENPVPPDRDDPTMIESLRRSQDFLDALFTWAVDGARALAERGARIEVPEEFARDRQEWQLLADPVGPWVDEAFARGEDLEFEFSDAYDAWKQWARARKVSPGRHQDFRAALRRHGFEPPPDGKHAGRRWRGGRLSDGGL